MTAEHERLEEARLGESALEEGRRYLSEPQWETAPEDDESANIRGGMLSTTNG